MNILVTGCMGFIGSNLVPDLLNQGHKVIGFDNLSKPSINPTDRMKKKAGTNWGNFTFMPYDICNYAQMASYIAAHGPIDSIIHLAAVGSIPMSFHNPKKTMEANVLGFTNIVELCRNFKIKKLVFASSSSVYGASSTLPRREGYEGAHLSPYSLSKRVNEELAIMLMPHDSRFVGLRFFNVYGPGQSLMGYYTAVIPRFITEEHPEVYGDGSTIRDFTFVDDVSVAITKALELDKSTIVNVGTGQTTSINQLLLMLGKQGQAIYKEPRVGEVKASWASTDNAKNILNFTANVSIEAGLAQTKDFYENFLRESLLESKA